MRIFFIVGGIIVALVLGKIFIFSKPVKDAPPTGKSSAKGGTSVSVDVLVINRETLQNQIFASGTILPNEEVDLKAELSGRLVALHIQEGATVKKGQLIAKINDRDLKAQLQKVGFNQDLAKKIEGRQQKLLNIEAINLQDYDVTANDINVLEAEKEVLAAQLEKTEIRAPFSGRIGLKNISQGAFVSPGTSIVTITQSNPVKVEFDVPEKYARAIRTGSTIKFRLNSDQLERTAKVVALDPKIDETLRTQKVRALASNPSEQIVPGMFVKVNVNLEANNSAIMIPTNAIVPVLKGKKVYVKRNGKAQEVMITTGLRTDDRVEILEGLQPGDSLITSAIITLKPNIAVRVN